MSNYWKTCIEEALSEIGINATEKQTKDLVLCVKVAHENYGMTHGYDYMSSPLEYELEEMRRNRINEIHESEARETALTQYIKSQYHIPVSVFVRDGRVQVERKK